MPLTKTIRNSELVEPRQAYREGLDPSRSTFFSTLFAALDQHSVRYCALHAHGGLLYGTDFAVDASEGKKLRPVFLALKRVGYLAVHWLEIESGEHRIVFAKLVDSETVTIDLVIGGNRRIRANQIVQRRRRDGIFWAAAVEDSWEPCSMDRISLYRRIVGGVRKLGDRFSRKGAFLVLLGPDGVGKTTLLRELSKTLAPVFPAQSIYRWRPSIFARARRLVCLPHSKPMRSPWGSISYLLFACLDFVSGYVLAIHSVLSRGGLVIFDRYYHDLLIDPKRYRYTGPMGLVRLFGKLVPPRDIFFVVLDAEEQTILSRKQQLPLDEIRRQRGAYREFAARAAASVLITTDRSLEQCREQAIQRIFPYLSERLAKRNPSWFGYETSVAHRGVISTGIATRTSLRGSLAVQNCERTLNTIPPTAVKMNRYNLLGVAVDAMTRSDLHHVIGDAVATEERRLIANHNLHSVYLRHHDGQFAEMYNHADCIYVDGMPIIFLAQALGLPLRAEHRITFLDSFEDLVEEVARKNWRLFYLGSKPGVAARGAEILRKRFRGLQIATQHGYFDAQAGSRENQSVIESINAFRPNILMVGMGMPRQEHWTLENLDAISANAVITSGATMDYFAGEIPVPPRWAGPFGLYGMMRLWSEPKRLWKRYLLEPWFVLGLFALDLLPVLKGKQRKAVISESFEEQ